MAALSPFRYPGGKSALSGLLSDIIYTNNLQDGIYVEPFAGGAGAGLELLMSEHMAEIIINDADPAIYAVWYAILHQKNRFLKMLYETPINITEWRRQQCIYKKPKKHSRIKLAFATFFLNRCNRSGIIAGAGPIGGQAQTGKWTLDVRFNRDELAERIEEIYMYKDRIRIFNLDAELLMTSLQTSLQNRQHLLYLDPPYYNKGSKLYLNHFKRQDHESLADFLQQQRGLYWVMTYDNAPEIISMYRDYISWQFDLRYSLAVKRQGSEIMILGPNINAPASVIFASETAS